MSKLVSLDCPRCGKTQEDAWYNRKICAPCRVDEEKSVARTAKGKAWAAVARAIRTGELVPLPCETCTAVKSQAHHDDYSKPLDVRWLCRSCHQRHHYKFGPGSNAYASA